MKQHFMVDPTEDSVQTFGVGTIINGNFRLQEKIGQGSFGMIFKCMHVDTEQIFAIKLEKRNERHSSMLVREIKVMMEMKHDAGFAKMESYGKDEDFNFIVMSYLGRNIESLLKKCGGGFSLATTVRVADQMIARLEALHDKNLIHRDIKPENFVIGHTSSSTHFTTIFLLDFGLAKYYMDSQGNHIPFIEKKGMIGTARYASVNAHLGNEQSRRDDMEALGYLLLYLAKGQLPWQNINAETKEDKYEKIKVMKTQLTVEQLCENLPIEFAFYFHHVKSLSFEEKPNYSMLRKLFAKIPLPPSAPATSNPGTNPLDWESLPEYRPRKKNPTVTAGTPSQSQQPVSSSTKNIQSQQQSQLLQQQQLQQQQQQNVANSAKKAKVTKLPPPLTTAATTTITNKPTTTATAAGTTANTPNPLNLQEKQSLAKPQNIESNQKQQQQGRDEKQQVDLQEKQQNQQSIPRANSTASNQNLIKATTLTAVQSASNQNQQQQLQQQQSTNIPQTSNEIPLKSHQNQNENGIQQQQQLLQQQSVNSPIQSVIKSGTLIDSQKFQQLQQQSSSPQKLMHEYQQSKNNGGAMTVGSFDQSQLLQQQQQPQLNQQPDQTSLANRVRQKSQNLMIPQPTKPVTNGTANAAANGLSNGVSYEESATAGGGSNLNLPPGSSQFLLNVPSNIDKTTQNSHSVMSGSGGRDTSNMNHYPWSESDDITNEESIKVGGVIQKDTPLMLGSLARISDIRLKSSRLGSAVSGSLIDYSNHMLHNSNSNSNNNNYNNNNHGGTNFNSNTMTLSGFGNNMLLSNRNISMTQSKQLTNELTTEDQFMQKSSNLLIGKKQQSTRASTQFDKIISEGQEDDSENVDDIATENERDTVQVFQVKSAFRIPSDKFQQPN